MNKLIFFVLGCLILISCEVKYYGVIITNNSSKAVSYIYNDSADTLSSAESKTYQVRAYTQPPKGISVAAGAMSIKMESKSDEYVFSDAESIDLRVFNTLPITITLKADDYIEDGGSVELAVESQKEKTAKIYTKNPKFTILSGYPTIIDWNIADDIMYVKIR
jgi:hypothetical protein